MPLLSTQNALLAMAFTALLASCGGGSDAPAPDAPTAPTDSESGDSASAPTPLAPEASPAPAADPGPVPIPPGGAPPPDVPGTEAPAVACRAPTYTPTTVGSGYALVFKGCDSANQAMFYDKSECVLNYRTGQIWEGTPAFGLPNGNRLGYNLVTHFDNRFQDQFPDGAGGFRRPTTAEVGAGTNALGYIRLMNANRLCGFNDWRLPAFEEFREINRPAHTYWLPPYSPGSFPTNWTQNPVGASPLPQHGTSFNYNGGPTYSELRSTQLYIRLVRG